MSQVNEFLKTLQPLWGNWYIDKLIGEGNFGKVYKILRNDWGHTYTSALKVINYPTKSLYLEAVKTVGDNLRELEKYFVTSLNSIITEISLLNSLKGLTNIVSYEDHLVVKNPNKLEWYILIRMEYLTSLSQYLENNNLTKAQVINLGMDICSAIEACSKNNIIHRDIKDDNIFITQNEAFKLGDFGISKELTSDNLNMTRKGTPLFMAPEVFNGKPYDIRCDIYSLGLVLYKLLNNGRLPFFPPYPYKILFSDKEKALLKRLSGEPLFLSDSQLSPLNKVIQKACAFLPEERYLTATEMKKDLSLALNNLSLHQKDEVVCISTSVNLQHSHTELDLSKDESAHTVAADTDKTELLTPSLADIDKTEFSCANTVLHAKESPNTLNSDFNATSNIINGGFVNHISSCFFVTDIYNSCFLYKFSNNLDKKSFKLICDDFPWFINIHNNWIYYSNSKDMDTLYRIKTDGSSKMKLCEDRAFEITIYDNCIYYSNESDNNNIYKINLDGSGRQKVVEHAAQYLNIIDNVIYYSNKSDNEVIYSFDIKRNTLNKLNSHSSSFVTVSNGFIYYINIDDNNCIYRLNIHEDGNEKLCNNPSKAFNISNNYIYYINTEAENRLYKMSLNNFETQRLIKHSCDYINIIGDYIFYCNLKENNSLFLYIENTNIYFNISKMLSNFAFSKDGWLYFS